MILTQEFLKTILHYDPDTGEWRWVKSRGGLKAGDPAGFIDRNGYKFIRIGSLYFSADLAHLYMTGERAKVDHKDGNKANDRWNNLRTCTRSQNAANSRHRRTATLPWKGIKRTSSGKWMARVHDPIRGETYLGSFDCPAAAHLAFVVEHHKCYGEFSRTR